MKRFLTMLLCLLLAAGLLMQPGLATGAQALVWEGAALPEEASGEDAALQVDAGAQAQLEALAAEREIMALVYLSDFQTVYGAASYDGAQLVAVPSGQQVRILGVQADEYGELWARVALDYQDNAYEGYISRGFLACSDERFLAWEEEHGLNRPARQSRAAGYADVNEFPESYRASLTALKHAHPNWTFVKMNTGLEWATVVAEELYGERSLVPDSFDEYMKRGPRGQGWSLASEMAVSYYLDPRNWINEEYIFQFEQLTYNASYHNMEAIQAFLNPTFMAGVMPLSDQTYAQTFFAIGQSLGVSPFHLASRVYIEQGTNGASPLISGSYEGFEGQFWGYYNYYNINAAGNTNELVFFSGLTHAKNEGWDTPYKSIYGGASFITSAYVRRGQDTVYLQKFDVDNSHDGMYWHQYQQAVHSPAVESKSIRQQYIASGALDQPFVFKIPVYENMPAEPQVLPVTSYAVTLSVPEGYADSTIWLNGVEHAGAVQQDGRLVVDAGGGHATMATMYKYDEAGVPVGMYVWTLSYVNGAYTATPVPELENLLSYHGFSVRIAGKAGIRFKTGVSGDTRKLLTSSGVAGFTLKEYGTLVMNNTYRAQYPLVLAGDKVGGGVAYGLDSSGVFKDAIFEAVDGRYRYTSVLVGLPATHYKTEYAFRGYIILTKGGRDYVIYGPTRTQSIYALAQMVLASGQYEEGSEACAFLQQLIVDGA